MLHHLQAFDFSPSGGGAGGPLTAGHSANLQCMGKVTGHAPHGRTTRCIPTEPYGIVQDVLFSLAPEEE
jgi:hypothetical protein